MSSKLGIAFIALIMLFIMSVLAARFLYPAAPPPPPTPASKDDLIVVDTPLPGASVSSPLTIAGSARGQWYFEASFPAKILDGNGVVLGVVPVTAQGEWMTSEYVPFAAQLTFAVSSTPTGTLVLEKDNPSGLPEHANQLEIPVRFATFDETPSGADGESTESTSVKLYFYNPNLDNTQCTARGLVAVTRTLPRTTTPLKESIELLLSGAPISSERAQGLTSEFPLSDVSLKSAMITNGVATLTFSDPGNKTSGGSCRVSIMRAQIEATAKQFPAVKSVRILPETVFQP